MPEEKMAAQTLPLRLPRLDLPPRRRAARYPRIRWRRRFRSSGIWPRARPSRGMVQSHLRQSRSRGRSARRISR